MTNASNSLDSARRMANNYTLCWPVGTAWQCTAVVIVFGWECVYNDSGEQVLESSGAAGHNSYDNSELGIGSNSDIRNWVFYQGHGQGRDVTLLVY